MRVKNFRGALEVITNLAILGVLSYTGYIVWNSQHQGPRLGMPRPQNLSGLARIAKGTAQRTVVIAMSPACPVCQENVPFIRKLADAVDRRNGQVGLILVFPERSKDVNEFLEANRLPRNRARIVRLRDIGISRIPVLAITEPSGDVSASYEGAIGSDQQITILRAVSGSA